jgi:hypothetical protein
VIVSVAEPDVLAAAVEVVRDAGSPLHWTVILDRVLKAGAIDPFTTPNVRGAMRSALRRGVDDGMLRVAGRGVYDLALPATER